MSNALTIAWRDHHRAPRCPPDPAFPDGVDLDVSAGAAPTCATALPYPARRCGVWEVTCAVCGLRVLATTAGRADDPRSIRVACRGSRR